MRQCGINPLVLYYSEVLVNYERRPAMISDIVLGWTDTIGSELALSSDISEIVHSGAHSQDWFHNSTGSLGNCKHKTFSSALSLAMSTHGNQACVY